MDEREIKGWLATAFLLISLSAGQGTGFGNLFVGAIAVGCCIFLTF